jgi:hypothetical protein
MRMVGVCQVLITEKFVGMVGLKGLEPLRPLERQNLNLVRLPIPPQPHSDRFYHLQVN